MADWHALTTGYDNTEELQLFSKEMIIDWLAYGLDPKQSVIFVQSHVPEHAELHVLLSMIAPLGWLERVPTYKDQQKELSDKDLSTLGFLGYPVLQTADVALYNATHVPVGQDQVPHIELSREIVRRFNFIFKSDVLVEPQSLLTQVPVLPGTDGRKMSKSYNNSIFLRDTSEEMHKKVMPMMTDPARQRRTDPGDPKKCPVFAYHKIYSDNLTQDEVTKGCTEAGIGCVDCKKKLLKFMDEKLAPYREERLKLATKPDYIQDVINDGDKKAKKVAIENMMRIKAAVKI